MTYTGGSVGPMWFRVMFPGLVIGALVALFGVVLLTNPGAGLLPSAALALIFLGILALVLIGAGSALGYRTRFRWRGWQAEEARRQEAAKQLADQALAPLRQWAGSRPPRNKTE